MIELIKDAYSFAKDSLGGYNGKKTKYWVIFVLAVESIQIVFILYLLLGKIK